MGHRAKLVAQGVAIGLAVRLFALLAWSLLRDKGGDLAAAAVCAERPQALDFRLERLDNTWASWCNPCKEEAPYLEQVWRDNRDRGEVVVGLNAKDLRSDALRFMKRFDLTFPVVRDGSGDAIQEYGATGFPETVVLDRKGRVVAGFAGAVNTDEEKERLGSALEHALSS